MGQVRGDRTGGGGFLGAQIPDFIITSLSLRRGAGPGRRRGGVATPGGFLRGDSPSPAPYGQHGTWVLRSGSAPRRMRAGVAWGLVEERGNDLMGGAAASSRRRACLACPHQERPRLPRPSPLCPSHHPLLPSGPTPTLSLMKEGLGRPRGGRRKMEALELSLNCSRS